MNAVGEQQAFDAQEALDRATYCLRLHPTTPLTDAATGTYYRTKRRLPRGQTVCDQYGNTAKVGKGGQITDIKSAPQEQVNKILKERKENSQ